jgi:hypothetical protein
MKIRYLVAIALGVLLGGGVTALALIPGPPAVQRPLFASLNGNNEIGADGKKGAGDPDGRGSFNGIIEEGKLCFGISVANIDNPTAAHVHRGVKSENGPVVVTLTEPAAGDPGTSSGCVAIGPELAKAIRKNPRKYYVNVHNEAFPDGAVRGQLFKR